jgi:hypothetical protein
MRKGHVATDTALSLFLLPCAGLVQPVAPKKILIFVLYCIKYIDA